ncbi:MAG: exodeoxyribonuclease VII small subunit [Planctomycetes bacterium]|jgi:exodeoxyribonuclease VII small subunit|nr:exodeoxyribonuclease VII small subunit [Phycisphaerae bacterium]NBB95431.1 exodeoxyribonuclease VII small subunit [Planctomycetota bacterium]
MTEPTPESTEQSAGDEVPMTFEQAIEKLETIVDEIEDGRVSLEESIDRYAEGTKLVKRCRAILDQAEKKIQMLAKGEGDELTPDGELADDEA